MSPRADFPGAGRFTDPITYSLMWDENGNLVYPKTRKAQKAALRQTISRETNADGSLTGLGGLCQAHLDYLLSQMTTIGDLKLTNTLEKSDANELKDFALQQRDRTCSRLAGEICGKDGPMDCPCGSAIKPNRTVLSALDAFGRQRLSKHYWMRDFLYSEVAEAHGIANVPNDAELAIKAGKAVCRNLLEPLRRVFGHVTIRSAFRSANVNGYCNCHSMNCSSNKASYANHIWDHLDGDGFMGATVCIVIPDFVDWMNEKAGRVLAGPGVVYTRPSALFGDGVLRAECRGQPDLARGPARSSPRRRRCPIRRQRRQRCLAVATQAQGQQFRQAKGVVDQAREAVPRPLSERVLRGPASSSARGLLACRPGGLPSATSRGAKGRRRAFLRPGSGVESHAHYEVVRQVAKRSDSPDQGCMA